MILKRFNESSNTKDDNELLEEVKDAFYGINIIRF